MSKLAQDAQQRADELASTTGPARGAKPEQRGKRKAATQEDVAPRAAQLPAEEVIACAPLKAVRAVTGGGRNKYVHIEFAGADGRAVNLRLYPIGLGRESNKVRDLVVEFFK